MKPTDKHKLCSHCEGRIALEAITCPYCNAEQTPAAAKATVSSSVPNSLYTPPYTNKGLRYSVSGTESAPAAPDTFKSVAPTTESPTPTIAAQKEIAQEAPNHFWPLFTLSLASIMATLGLLQLFFSDNGLLRLEWDSSYWFVYCIAALPLFFFGIKKVNQLK
jgi:hypothetical protein